MRNENGNTATVTGSPVVIGDTRDKLAWE